MSHSGSSGNSGSHGEGGSAFHYAVGDNYNPLGSYSDIYKLEHLTEGLRINNGIRFAILFIAFAGWLYIVYWLRHHELLSQQSIGVNAASTPTTKEDKSIVASIRNAFPFKTSADFGSFYTPTPQPNNSPGTDKFSQIVNSENNSTVRLNAGEAISAPLTYIDADFDQRFGLPSKVSYPNTQSAVTEPIISNSTKSVSANQINTPQPYINSLYSHYSMPMQNPSNTSLRTIVTH